METPTSSTSSSRRRGWTAAGVFALLGAGLLAMLGGVGRYLEGDAFIDRRVAALGAVESGQAVIAGGSVSRHIELSALCIEGTNLWEPHQDIFEIAALQRHLEDRGIVPSLWIVGYVPGLTTIDKGADGARSAERRAIAYRTLHAAGDYRLIGGDWEGALRSVAAPVLGYPEWRGRIRAAVRGDAFDMERPAPDRPELDPAILEEQSRKRAEEARAEQEKMRYHDDGIAGRAMAEILAMNSALLRQGSRLVLVEMPVTAQFEALGYGMTPKDLAREERLIDRLEKEGATVVRLEDLPDQPATRFRDFIHLARSAGFAFTRELGAELARRELMEKPACAATQAGS